MKEQITSNKLKGVPKTLLISLKARAYESLDKKGIIHDDKSIEIAKTLGCKLDNPKEISLMTRIGTGQRTLVFDDYTNHFLQRFPQGTVVDIACGLDTRYHRLDNGKLRWYDLDFPETIEIRKHFFKENERYHFIEKSVLDFSWIDEIPKDHPVLLTAEGLFCYFKEEDIIKLLKQVAKGFEYVEFIIEAMSPYMVKNQKRHPDMKGYNAPFQWGINSGKETDAWQTGFKFVDERYFMEECNKRNLLFQLVFLLPKFGKSMKIFRLVNQEGGLRMK
ncbi:class I SAM-dependent methyltransferase [Weeksellaceae bacterium TAE3-ERU29]|nr:class I SAM-dependent methyltransferase [Weeksellaceae bacterium TAE3-ERU29]